MVNSAKKLCLFVSNTEPQMSREVYDTWDNSTWYYRDVITLGIAQVHKARAAYTSLHIYYSAVTLDNI